MLSRRGYIINYANYTIILARRLQTEIALSNTKVEYIALSQTMRDILPIVSLIKYIEFVLKLQGETPEVMCSIFEKLVTFCEDNQGTIVLAVYPQMQPHTKHIAIKYHHFCSFVSHGYVDIKHVDTKEHIADIFMKPLDSELFIYLHYKLNGWWVKGILLCEEILDYTY